MTSPLTPERLAEIRERAEKADRAISPQSDDTDMLAVKVCREDVPALLDEVERLQAEYTKIQMHVPGLSATLDEERWNVQQLRVENARLRKEAAELWASAHLLKDCGWERKDHVIGPPGPPPNADVVCNRCGARNPYADGGA